MGNNPILFSDADGGWAHDGNGDPIKISWKDYKEGQIITLDPAVVNAYYGGSISAFKPDIWDRWAMSSNWLSKTSYNIVNPFVVYGSSFFGNPRHIGGEPANKKELTGAGVDVMMSLMPLEAAGSSGIAKVVARTGMTDLQLVTRVAQKAEAAIGGTGGIAGTLKHTYAKNLLNRYQSIYGDRGFSLGSNYFRGPVGKGFLDVVNHKAMTIYDFKFGNAVMSNSQFLKYSNSFPGYSIQVIRP